MKKRNHPRGDTYKFILMALLKEGLLDFKELEERLTIFLSQFMILGYSIVPSKFWLDEDSRHRRRDRKPKKDFDVGIECEDLIKKNTIILNKDNKYELTEEGKGEAIEITKHIEKSASRLKKSYYTLRQRQETPLLLIYFWR